VSEVSNERTHRQEKHADRLDGIFYGLVFIWGGFVLAAELAGFHARFSCWTTGWGVFFGGVGVLALLGTFVRFLIPRYRVRVGVGLVFACVMLGIGLGDRAVWIWPVLLGVISLTILRGVVLQRR